MTAQTPGQAAYEAYCRHVDRISPPPWEHLHSGYQDGWQQVAQAGHVVIAAREPRPAPVVTGYGPAEQAAPGGLLCDNRPVMTALMLALSDPGSVTPRAPMEALVSWQRRAVIEHAAPLIMAAREPQPAPVKPDLADVERLVGEALGEASMCWDPRPEGVFDSVHAGRIVGRLMGVIRGLARPFPDEGQSAPELAGAMRESRALLGYLDDFTRAVIDLDDGARLVAIGRLARAARAVRKKAGLPSVEGR